VVLVSALILGGVGLTFGTLIAVANKKLKVDEDPRIDAVDEILPGSNCGACGYAGCRSFAEGVVGGEVQPAACTQMSADAIEAVADFLGVEAGEAQKRVARLLCAGGSAVAGQEAEYVGAQSCIAAAGVAGGGKGCSWGCLGLADCVVVCDYDAIHMNEQELPVVTPELCTACGDCVEACPKELLVIMPLEHSLLVQCRSALEGDAAEALCAVACTGCGKCVADAAPGLIEMVRGLPVIDYSKNHLADPAATSGCPTGAIVWVDGTQQLEPSLERSGSASA